MAETTDAARLCRFHVQGLFGEFNHEIPLNDETRVTALIGPNGMGKTACLRLINALFRRQWSVFSGTEFRQIDFTFTDGSTIEVKPLYDVDSATDVSDNLGVVFTTTRSGEEEAEVWFPRAYDDQTARSAGRIEGYLPFLTRVGPKSWRVDSTRQMLSLQEVIETYSDRLPEPVRRSLSDQPPKHLASIINQIDCHLIETQRLLVLDNEEYRRPASGNVSNLAISRKAQVLKSIIATDLALYASISQSLDRSFPRRVLQQEATTSPADFAANLAELDQLRAGLTEAGILDPEEDDALPNADNPSPAIAAVLNVYVNDTRQKLDVLANLRSKILLFIDLIDGRFKPKSVTVDKDNGFVVRRSLDIEVPLEKLSSGEQHQLVLFFELLFELRKNALILIDEPELSLHVAWQRQFIPDLRRIISLNQFDVLLATHSPQLIGAWDQTVVELGNVD